MGWAGNVARTGERRGAYSVLLWKSEERNKLEDLSAGGSVILNWDGEAWTGLIWLVTAKSGGML